MLKKDNFFCVSSSFADDLISRTKLIYLRYYISGNFAFWLGSVSAECFIHLGSLGLSQFWSVSSNIETASEIKYFNKFEELFQQEHEHYLQIVRTLNNAMNTLKPICITYGLLFN